MSDTTAHSISPLRARMIEDMNVRNFVPATQREYIRAVKKLAAFLGRSPDTATVEELRGFQVHLSEVGANPGVINATVTALRLFLQRDGWQAGGDTTAGLRLRAEEAAAYSATIWMRALSS